VLFRKTTRMVSPTVARITGPSMPSESSHTRVVTVHEVGVGIRWVKVASVYPR